MMGDDEHRDPGCAHAANEAKQPIDLVAGQICGRLVEHENPGWAAMFSDGAGDRKSGTLARLERRDRPVDVELVPKQLDGCLGFSAALSPAHRPSPPARVAEAQPKVLNCAERVDQSEILVDKPQARVVALAGLLWSDQLPRRF